MPSKFSGCTDRPAVADQFGIQKYIDGLVLFKTGWKFYYKLPAKLRAANPRLAALAEALGCKLGGTWAELKAPVQIEDRRTAELLRELCALAAGQEAP